MAAGEAVVSMAVAMRAVARAAGKTTSIGVRYLAGASSLDGPVKVKVGARAKGARCRVKVGGRLQRLEGWGQM
jgi:hypothetical protein